MWRPLTPLPLSLWGCFCQHTPAQMLLHCLEHWISDQPNWELLLISYCLCVWLGLWWMQQLAKDQTLDRENRKQTIYPSERSSPKYNTFNIFKWTWPIVHTFHITIHYRHFFSKNPNHSWGESSWSWVFGLSFSFFCTQQTYCIILSSVFTIKSRGSKLQKIKGHRVCHLETMLPSLLTHPEKGHAIIYLIPPPSLLLSSHACIQPASRGMNTLRGLRAVLWTTCAVFTWLSRERVRKTGTLKPNRCMIQRRELWRVHFLYKSMLLLEQTAAWSCPRKHLHALWLFSLVSQNALLLFCRLLKYS